MKYSRRQFIGLAGALGLAGCARGKRYEAEAPPASPKGSLTFATISDMHVLDARSTGVVNRAVAQVNADPHIDFTIVLGDIATDGRFQELNLAKACFERLEKPYLCVPGNHDLLAGTGDSYANYDRGFDHREWREKDDGWVFLGIDTCNGTASDVTVPPDRVAWIGKQLEKIKPERPIALFSHHPFNPHTQAYRVQNAGEVLGLFEGHNLKLVSSGHWHGNQVEERDGTIFITTACCSTTRGNFDDTPEKGYRRYVLDDGVVLGHEFIEVSA